MITDTKQQPKLPGAIEVTVGIHADVGGQTPPAYEGLSLLDVAEIHEFGLGQIERSFIRAWADSAEVDVQRALDTELPKLMTGSNPQLIADRIGLYLQTKAQRFIADGRVQPDISDATKKLKGSSVPLKDTGLLQSSILGRGEVLP